METLLFIGFIFAIMILVNNTFNLKAIDPETCECAYARGELRKNLKDWEYIPNCLYCGTPMEISQEDIEHHEKMDKFYEDNPLYEKPDYSEILLPRV